MAKTKNFLYLFVLLAFLLIGTNAYAATVGEQLPNPEPGWERIDNTDSRITYGGSWTTYNATEDYQGSENLTVGKSGKDLKMSITFTGSKFRLIGTEGSTQSTQIDIYINGTKEATISQNLSGDAMLRSVLCYEKIFDAPGQYLIEVVNRTDKSFSIDAVDISEVFISPPASLKATAGNSQVVLNWEKVADATGYNVKRSAKPGEAYATVASVNSPVHSYTDTTLTNGTAYYYVVTAANSVGESKNSKEVSTTPQESLPNPPAKLVAEAGGTLVNLSWDAVVGATGYNVKKSLKAEGPYATIASPTSPSYVDTGLKDGTTYYYVVTTVNAAGESANSNEALATCSDGSALLLVTTGSGDIDYHLSMNEVNAFINWYKSKASGGKGDPFYVFNKKPIPPYTSRKDYLIFDNIMCFKVYQY